MMVEYTATNMHQAFIAIGYLIVFLCTLVVVRRSSGDWRRLPILIAVVTGIWASIYLFNALDFGPSHTLSRVGHWLFIAMFVVWLWTNPRDVR